MMRSHILLSFFLSFAVVNCFNFPFESTQLQDKDIGDFTSISFGNLASPSLTTTANSTCRAYPDTPSWPSDSDWTLLNASLSGALLKPTPPGSVCYQCSSYDKAKCDSLLNDARQSRFYINDPLTVLTAWTQGNTCEPTASAGNASCGQGGFAVYVVNATTVKQIQVAVNFARNKNLRLVIKNSGHDFYGRSTGAGSLSIWTHYLKDFEFLPSYNVLGSSVMAARVGSGIESWEAYQYMDHYNMTLAVPGGSTLAPYGGWMQGGGHSVLASTYGLGADQPLELQVVTADGRFVTASPEQNSDLFYAMLGGGPGTFGVVTSAIVKAYPPIEVSESAIAFNGGSATTPPAQVTAQNLTAFWAGVNLFFRFGAEVVDNGGATYNYVSQLSNTSYNFRTTIDLPGMTIAQNLAFVQPLITALINLGIPVNATQNTVSASWGPGRLGVGDAPGNSRFASRFFPRANWGDDDLFEQTMGAIRESVEAGYSFHGIHMAPTLSAAGYPGCRNHVPRHFRNTIMHSDSFDSGPIRGGSAAAVQGVKDAWTRHNFYMDKIRNVTVGGGAYINEGDVKEPNWQESFFGERYGELVGVKRKWDPWGLFWGPALVGSEAWSVRTEDGLPTQVGMLCKTGVEMGGLVVGQKVKSSI